MAYLLIDRENVKGRLLQNVLSYTHYNSFIQCKLLMYVIVSVARKTETQTACVNFSSYKCSSWTSIAELELAWLSHGPGL